MLIVAQIPKHAMENHVINCIELNSHVSDQSLALFRMHDYVIKRSLQNVVSRLRVTEIDHTSNARSVDFHFYIIFITSKTGLMPLLLRMSLWLHSFFLIKIH